MVVRRRRQRQILSQASSDKSLSLVTTAHFQGVAWDGDGDGADSDTRLDRLRDFMALAPKHRSKWPAIRQAANDVRVLWSFPALLALNGDGNGDGGGDGGDSTVAVADDDAAAGAREGGADAGGHDATGAEPATVASRGSGGDCGPAGCVREEPPGRLLRRAAAALRGVLAEVQQLWQQANAAQDFDQAAFYLERVKLLSAALLADGDGGGGGGDPSGRAAVSGARGTAMDVRQFECPTPGLLLRQDRFSGESDAFLGRGSSGAVSRGVWVQVVAGRREVRTEVAVKEVPKTGASSEREVMREQLLLQQKLRGEALPNIIRLYAVTSNSNTYFVIMQCCHFSLAAQPEEFQQFLHQSHSSSSSSPSSFSSSTNKAKGKGKRPAGTNAGSLVLNALVQDLLRAVGLLHARHIMHCDIKPGNLLVSFNRGSSGREHAYAPKNFHLAQLVVADFGVSRVFTASGGAARGSGAGDDTATATINATALSESDGNIVGTEAFMAPEMLALFRRQQEQRRHGGSPPVAASAGTSGSSSTSGSNGADAAGDKWAPALTEAQLVANDAFGCGCAVAFLCSRGLHPFGGTGPLLPTLAAAAASLLALPARSSIPDNILKFRRRRLRGMGLRDPNHEQLVDVLTQRDPAARWTVRDALRRSAVFTGGAGAGAADDDRASMLLDTISLHQQPQGSCRDQLLSPALAAVHPKLDALVCGPLDDCFKHLLRRHAALPAKLDPDSLYAILAYTFDDPDGNIYFPLNRALRRRKEDPAEFQRWQGYLFYLMRALGRLPTHKGVVYRGGNQGLDQTTVLREYKLGRPIQWAAFSSTSTDAEASRGFVDKKSGVLFKITVASGTSIGPFSAIRRENEVLLSPNSRFTVSHEMYKDGDGYACVDLVEVQGSMLAS